jgi:hypothetical protein
VVVVVPTVGGGLGGVVGSGTVVGATVSGIVGTVHCSFVGGTLKVDLEYWFPELLAKRTLTLPSGPGAAVLVGAHEVVATAAVAAVVDVEAGEPGGRVVLSTERVGAAQLTVIISIKTPLTARPARRRSGFFGSRAGQLISSRSCRHHHGPLSSWSTRRRPDEDQLRSPSA